VSEVKEMKEMKEMEISGKEEKSNTRGHGSNKARRAAQKVARHSDLWKLAHVALEEIDSSFASRVTAIAFTKNFVGSAHIDTQNTGPFYGLSLGDFSIGTGQLCVEVSAREVAHVNTRNRLGMVDGRFSTLGSAVKIIKTISPYLFSGTFC